MSKKDKKGVPTKTDEKTILEQVPSDKMQDFVQRMMALAQRNLAEKNRLKKEEETYRTDVLYEPPAPKIPPMPILDNSEEIDDEGNLISIEPSNPPLRSKGNTNEME